MPIEAGILAPRPAGMHELEQIRRAFTPWLSIGLIMDGACVEATDADGSRVAVLYRPQTVGYGGDVSRCVDEPVAEAEMAAVWTEAVVPFRMSRSGLEWVAAVALATGGQLLVKGAGG